MTPVQQMNDVTLQVILEGKIFEEQPLGGISRIYHEILPRICNMDKQVSFSILTAGSLMQSLPEHPRIIPCHSRFTVHRFFRPQTIFWQIQDYVRSSLQLSSIPQNKNSIWHTTYFQLPNRWLGSIVTTVYDLIHEKFPQFFTNHYDDILRKRKRRAILAADKIICISDSVRSDVMNMYGLPQERVIAIPLACGDRFRQLSQEEIASEFQIDRPFILYVGMRQHYKNFKTLLSAYSLWSYRHEIKLLVVGAPFSKEEQESISANGLQLHIIPRSNITDEQLCALYNQALAFVYPSLSEGFGIPLLEAMACGCQIVASRIPVFREVAKDVPYFFDPLNRDELISALDAACFSTKSRIRRDDVLANYSWDRTARETLAIYRELAHKAS